MDSSVSRTAAVLVVVGFYFAVLCLIPEVAGNSTDQELTSDCIQDHLKAMRVNGVGKWDHRLYAVVSDECASLFMVPRRYEYQKKENDDWAVRKKK